MAASAMRTVRLRTSSPLFMASFMESFSWVLIVMQRIILEKNYFFAFSNRIGKRGPVHFKPGVLYLLCKLICRLLLLNVLIAQALMPNRNSLEAAGPLIEFKRL